MTSTTAPPDADLGALLPARSRGRNVALAAAGVGVLAAAWFSPVPLDVSIRADDGGGMWAPLDAGNHVAVARQLDPQAWPWLEVQEVADAPGAVVEGAWLITDEEWTSEVARPAIPAGASALDELRLRFPDADLPEGGGLPRRLSAGDDDAVLLVLWRVEDCAALDAGGAQVVLRSAFGSGGSEDLDDITSPGFDVGLLREEGVC